MVKSGVASEILGQGLAPATQMIELEGVHKAFAGKPAVQELTFHAPVGKITGLLGPNGSGKTTTLRLLLGLLVPDAGEVRVLGAPPGPGTADRIGYLPEERGLYRRMRVDEVLRFYASIKGAHPSSHDIQTWLERLGIERWAKHRVENLSKGTAQKVQFAATVLHDPKLLILDEPFSGLDPVSREGLKRIVLELADRGTTILLSTHDMNLAEQLCESVVMLHRGRKVLDERLDTIRARHGCPRLLVRGALHPGADPTRLEHIAGVARHRSRSGTQSGEHEFSLVEGADPGVCLRELTQLMSIERFEAGSLSLNEVFLKLAGSDDEP